MGGTPCGEGVLIGVHAVVVRPITSHNWKAGDGARVGQARTSPSAGGLLVHVAGLACCLCVTEDRVWWLAFGGACCLAYRIP